MLNYSQRPLWALSVIIECFHHQQDQTSSLLNRLSYWLSDFLQLGKHSNYMVKLLQQKKITQQKSLGIALSTYYSHRNCTVQGFSSTPLLMLACVRFSNTNIHKPADVDLIVWSLQEQLVRLSRIGSVGLWCILYKSSKVTSKVLRVVVTLIRSVTTYNLCEQIHSNSATLVLDFSHMSWVVIILGVQQCVMHF